MPAHHLIRQASGGTPASLPASRRDLPEDLLREASQRLGVIALLSAGLWIVADALGHLAGKFVVPADPRWRMLGFTDAVAVAAVIVSIALYVYTRRSRRDPAFIVDLGLWYMMFSGLALGIVWHWDGAPEGWHVMPMIGWNGVVTLMVAAIVPSPPRKMAVAAFITVSMNPLGMLLEKLRPGGSDFGSAGNLLLMHYPDYLLAGVSVVISHIVSRLGHHVRKARELGSYQVGDLIGKGGMGEVYMATHRMLARPAAIKLIRPETIGGGKGPERELAIRRFHREAEVAANLRSPHTVELYDFGATEDETLYFVMELLEGMTLDALVQGHGRLPPNRVIHIMRQVCESLEEAHARGLVHRDIKPANIHLGRLGLQHDFVKVLDFGLVKSVKQPPGEASLGTATGMAPGTPDYMAPEMTLGETVDGRADLYALGCVAYYLLTGQPIFEASNVFHMIARHLNDTPVPPSQRAGIELPPELERLVLACLAKSPAARPQSAAELNRALARIAVEPWGELQAAAWWSSREAAA